MRRSSILSSAPGPESRSPSGFERYFLVLLVLLTTVVAAGHLRAYFSGHFVPEDLGAFYCGGKVVLEHQDPYRVQPLLDCERNFATVDSRWAGWMVHEGVNAAPLPGYAFIPFAALAMLPVRSAVVAYGLLLVCATFIIGYCVSKMSALPLAAALAVAFVGVTYGASSYGQLAPFAAASIALGALLLRSGRPKWAAVAASGALMQPQFGLPVVLAMLLFVPQARAMLVVVLVALALGTIGVIGVRGLREYSSVLHLHARAELNAPFQYSLTWLVHAFGGSAQLALMMGTISFFVLFAICLLVLARAKERALQTGAVILLPAAFAVFAGVYTHLAQTSVALLAAIVLINRHRFATALLLAAALLMVPFPDIKPSGFSALATLALMLGAVWCVVFFSARSIGLPRASITAATVCALVACLIGFLAAIRPPNQTMLYANFQVVHDPSAMASMESQYVNDLAATRDSTPTAYYVLQKLPTWCGLALTLWFGSALLLGDTTTLRSLRWASPATSPSPGSR